MVATTITKMNPARLSAQGTITTKTLRRFAAFRDEQTVPFAADSADLIHETRMDPDNQP